MLDEFITARRAAAPLIGIQTVDPAKTIRTITKADHPSVSTAPLFKWDFVNGIIGLTDKAQSIAQTLRIDGINSQNPVEALSMAQQLPEESILFVLFGQLYLAEGGQREGYITALWNLRDVFKRTGRQVILLSPFFALPPELAVDFLILTDPLPKDEELGRIVDQAAKDGNLSSAEFQFTKQDRSKAIDNLTGLSTFAAEQAIYMALRKEGIDHKMLMERKARYVELAGARVHEGDETFKSVRGNGAVLEAMKAELNGRRPPKVIAFMEELEKAIGTDLDTSGTSQSMKGLWLSWTENNNVRSIMATGVPGTGKSLLYKATAGEAGIPGVEVNLSTLKGSLVGQSEANLMRVLDMLTTIGRGEVLLIATANNIKLLPPEIKGRFYATFFFDTPTQVEREAMWTLYKRKYGLDDEEPESEGWVGREIRNCCDIAWRLNIPLKRAARYIIPVTKSSYDDIMRMRNEAAGNYLSASYDGPYVIESASEKAERTRSVSLE